MTLAGTLMAPGCRPQCPERPANGAIAQLGERVVRNDEVGGSIPPGSTTLRPSGYAWRSRAVPEGRSVVPGEASWRKAGRNDPDSPSIVAIQAKAVAL